MTQDTAFSDRPTLHVQAGEEVSHGGRGHNGPPIQLGDEDSEGQTVAEKRAWKGERTPPYPKGEAATWAGLCYQAAGTVQRK